MTDNGDNTYTVTGKGTGSAHQEYPELYDKKVKLDALSLEGILPANSSVTVVEVNPALSEGTKTTTQVVGAEDEDYVFLLPAGEMVTITVTVEDESTEYIIDCSELYY